MLEIKTIEDILRNRTEKLLPIALATELERYFRELAESLTGRQDTWETHDLKEDGPILVMQPGVDDPKDLGAYGMTREFGGLYEAPIEFTSMVKLDGMELFKTILVLNNSFCLAIYSEVSKFGPKFDEHLRGYLID